MKLVRLNGKALRYMIETGSYKTVLLSFHHGLGDAISFYYNVLPVIKAEYPTMDFFFDTHMGQEDYFGHVDKDPYNYDIVVDIVFPCSEWDTWSNETRAERCLHVEFDIDKIVQADNYYEVTEVPVSPLVGVHYKSTSSVSLCYNEELGKKIWDKIISYGLIPIDTAFSHPQATIEQHPFKFQDRNVDNIKPDVKLLFSLIGVLGGFAGVASGNFWTALCTLPPDKILFLENDFPVTKPTRLPVHHMKGYNEQVMNEWLDDISGNKIYPKEYNLDILRRKELERV